MRLLFSILILAYLLVIHTANAASLSYEDYAKLPEKSMMTMSPSGKKLAYRLTDSDRDYLVVVDLSNGTVLRAVDIASVDPDNIVFAEEERIILRVSDNKKLFGFRGRHDISVAFSFNLETGNLHQLLTQGKGIPIGQTQLGSIIGISPDKKFAYMPAYDKNNNYSLLRTDLSKRKTPRIHKKGTKDTVDFFVDREGELLARERFNNERNLHRLEAWRDGEWVEIFRQETEIATVGFSGVTPDFKNIVMIRQDREHGRWAYYTLSLEDGSEAGPIFSREDKDVENVITDLQRVVYGVKYSGFKPSYEFFDDKLNARINGIQHAVPEMAVTLTDFTPDWSNLVLHVTGAGSAGQFLRYNGGQLDSLGAARPNIGPESVHHIQVDSYPARDNLNIPTLLTLPNGVEKKALPTVVLPHGGPESYDTITFDYLAQYFASQGYLVIQPQFRGSEGFGVNHLLAGRGEWGRKMQDDLTDAVAEYTKRGLIDPERVCIVGASYGGYAALAGATFTPDVYKCAVSINGVADIPQMMRDDKRDHGDNHWVVAYWERVISKGNADTEHLKQISPINSVDNVEIPVLLIHGEHDLVVSIDQSEDMYKQLKKAGKAATFIELDDGDHYLSNAGNRAKALEAIDQFIKQHLN